MGTSQSSQEMRLNFNFVQLLDHPLLGSTKIYRRNQKPFDFVVGWNLPRYLPTSQLKYYADQINSLISLNLPGLSKIHNLKLSHETETFCGTSSSQILQSYYNFTLKQFMNRIKTPLLEEEVWYVLLTLIDLYAAYERLQIPFQYLTSQFIYLGLDGTIQTYCFTPLLIANKQSFVPRMEHTLASIALNTMNPVLFRGDFKFLNNKVQEISHALDGFSALLKSFVIELVKGTSFNKQLFSFQIKEKVNVGCFLSISESMVTEQKKSTRTSQLMPSQQSLRTWHKSYINQKI